MSKPPFLEAELLRKLERLTIASKGRVRGTLQGKRRSRLLGSSLEFADFRPYAPGDDIRRIDWNVYGRTGKAFIRQYWDEQELNVRLYVDESRSMRFGESGSPNGSPASSNKLAYALRLAASVGYTALSGEDLVSASSFADRITATLPSIRGKGSAGRLFDFFERRSGLDDSSEERLGSDDLSDAFLQPGALPRKPGQSWLFTDGLYGSGLEQTLNAFAAARQHLVFVQLLSSDELNPPLAGELKLIDSESGAAKEVAIGGGVMAAYRAVLREHTETIRHLCAERGFAYLLVDTSVPVADTAVKALLSEGLLM